MRIQTVAVVALLDRPNPESFGMVAFVARHLDGSFRIHGLEGQDGTRLAAGELDCLISEGHALGVQAEAELRLGCLVAGWIGEGFRQMAERARAPTPRVPAAQHLLSTNGHGRFWIDTADIVYHQHLLRWLREAAREVFDSDSAELADLMTWVLPNNQLTWAALWHTRRDEGARREELQWWTRLERDAGHSVDEAAMQQRFQDLRES